MKIAVLGGGITGLVATHLLLEEGHEVTCLEAAERCGGLCRSEVVDGFVADRAGGHIMFSKDQEVLGFKLQTVKDVVWVDYGQSIDRVPVSKDRCRTTYF